MNDQSLHRTGLPSAKLAEFIPRNTDDFSRVQFGRSMLNFLILNPVVSVFKAAKKQNRQFSSLWLRETYDGFPDLCEFAQGSNLPQVRAHSSPNLRHNYRFTDRIAGECSTLSPAGMSGEYGIMGLGQEFGAEFPVWCREFHHDARKTSIELS